MANPFLKKAQNTPSPTPPPVAAAHPASSTTVIMQQEKMNIPIFLLCFFVPPVIWVMLLIRGRFLAFLGYWLCIGLGIITLPIFVGGPILLITEVMFAIKASKSMQQNTITVQHAA